MDEFRKISLAVGRNSGDLVTALEDALLRNDYERFKEFGIRVNNVADMQTELLKLSIRTVLKWTE